MKKHTKQCEKNMKADIKHLSDICLAIKRIATENYKNGVLCANPMTHVLHAAEMLAEVLNEEPKKKTRVRKAEPRRN